MSRSYASPEQDTDSLRDTRPIDDALWFLVINFAYHLGLAIVVGGGLALGLAAAPALFRSLPSRSLAGNAFGEVLARWDGVAVLSALLVALTGFLRAVNYETPDARHWVRYGLIALMLGAVVHAHGWSGPVARQLRRQTAAFDDLPDSAPARLEFAKLHAAARRSMSLAILAGLVALALS